MVRLGVRFSLKTVNYTTQFQFQYGSIGRQTERIKTMKEQSFNSSMVRLGGFDRRSIPGVYCVSIPVWFDWELPLICLRIARMCFNSSMVRLGDVYQ